MIVLSGGSLEAYVGPGPGMTVLGALWAVIAAVILALFVIIKYPFKYLLRKMRGNKKSEPKGEEIEDVAGPEQ
jgi:hypothetical protein